MHDGVSVDDDDNDDKKKEDNDKKKEKGSDEKEEDKGDDEEGEEEEHDEEMDNLALSLTQERFFWGILTQKQRWYEGTQMLKRPFCRLHFVSIQRNPETHEIQFYLYYTDMVAAMFQPGRQCKMSGYYISTTREGIMERVKEHISRGSVPYDRGYASWNRGKAQRLAYKAILCWFFCARHLGICRDVRRKIAGEILALSVFWIP